MNINQNDFLKLRLQVIIQNYILLCDTYAATCNKIKFAASVFFCTRLIVIVTIIAAACYEK